MKTIIFLGIILFCLNIGINQQQLHAQENNCSHLVWSDEFDGTSATPDADKWGYDTGGGGWGNQEEQTYTDQRVNSWVEDGKLFIKAKKSSGSWTSARLVSKNKGDWLYGRIEVKAKLPTGKGTWPAIWMLPTDWEYGNWPASGEIDIMEHVGYDQGKIHGTVHTEAYNHGIGTQKGGSVSYNDVSTNFHVYTIEWSETEVKWFVDDHLYFTFQNENKTYKEWPFDKRFHLLLNIAIGGTWGGAQGIDESLTEAQMEIDYVRVYQGLLPDPVIQGSNAVKKNTETSFSVDPVEGAVYEWSFPEDVTVVSGGNTNQVQVLWGQTSGDVGLTIRTTCDTLTAENFHVKTIVEPEGKYYIPIVDSENNMVWTTEAGDNNTITLSGTDNLKVDYNIQEPNNNPAIVYEFEDIMDLSEYKEMAVMLKANSSNLPAVVRLDLMDNEGRVNTNDLFKITSFEADNNFHLHYYEFGQNPNGSYDLGIISKIKIYINYGAYGKKGASSIELKDMYLAKPGTTSTKKIEVSTIRVYPNPFTNAIYISGINAEMEAVLYNQLGQMVEKQQTNSSVLKFKQELTSGVYFLQLTNQNGLTSTHRLIKQ